MCVLNVPSAHVHASGQLPPFLEKNAKLPACSLASLGNCSDAPTLSAQVWVTSEDANSALRGQRQWPEEQKDFDARGKLCSVHRGSAPAALQPLSSCQAKSTCRAHSPGASHRGGKGLPTSTSPPPNLDQIPLSPHQPMRAACTGARPGGGGGKPLALTTQPCSPSPLRACGEGSRHSYPTWGWGVRPPPNNSEP